MSAFGKALSNKLSYLSRSAATRDDLYRGFLKMLPQMAEQCCGAKAHRKGFCEVVGRAFATAYASTTTVEETIAAMKESLPSIEKSVKDITGGIPHVRAGGVDAYPQVRTQMTSAEVRRAKRRERRYEVGGKAWRNALKRAKDLGLDDDET